MSDEIGTPLIASEDADALMRLGVEALGAGKFQDAVTLLEQAAQLAPADPVILHNLGCALFSAKRMPEAEKALHQSAGITNSPLTWVILGETQERLGQPARAFQCYERALKSSPDYYRALVKLGALKEAMGDKPGGRDCYELALQARPRDLHAMTRYTALAFDKELKKVVDLWEDALAHVGDNLDARANILEQLVCKKEWSERIKRGEMPYHASRPEELFFNYALDHVHDLDATQQARMAANPHHASTRVAAGLAKFCLKERHEAERLFRSVPERIAGHILEAVRFEPTFYNELRSFTDADLTRTLPPVVDVAPLTPDGKGILYLSCNFTYFRAFASPMAVSLRERSPNTPVHIHIMDASEEETALAFQFMKKLAPMRFGLTVERPGLTAAPSAEARSYYHAVRFIRYYEHLRHYGTPLWLMDVDAVINRDLGPLFAMLDNNDIAVRIRPGRLEPWNQFNACVVGAGTSDNSFEYLRLIAAYLAYFFQRKELRWGIDQLAMYGVFADMEDRGAAPRLALLGEREVDYEYRDDGFVWCNSGAAKFQHLQRLCNPGSLPMANFEDNKFVGVFERYWNESERINAAIRTGP